jgi:microcystin degradation protein MlrC
VKCLTDGTFLHTTPMGPGEPADYGPCARLIVGGIDVTRRKIVALKSSDHFRAAFRPLAAAIIGCNTPGIVSADLTTLPYKRLKRPIWPLDRALELAGITA